MKKIFEIPRLTIAQFELENVVTESSGSTYEQDAAQFTISGKKDENKNYANQILEWKY